MRDKTLHHLADGAPKEGALPQEDLLNPVASQPKEWQREWGLTSVELTDTSVVTLNWSLGGHIK